MYAVKKSNVSYAENSNHSFCVTRNEHQEYRSSVIWMMDERGGEFSASWFVL